MHSSSTTLWGLSLLLLIALVVPPARAQDSDGTTQTGFLLRTLEYNGQTHRYQVFVPPDYTPERHLARDFCFCMALANAVPTASSRRPSGSGRPSG